MILHSILHLQFLTKLSDARPTLCCDNGFCLRALLWYFLSSIYFCIQTTEARKTHWRQRAESIFIRREGQPTDLNDHTCCVTYPTSAVSIINVCFYYKLQLCLLKSNFCMFMWSVYSDFLFLALCALTLVPGDKYIFKKIHKKLNVNHVNSTV